ncbi:hypothetical protein [Gynuella sunshinyii]|uniref:hypothetical protein n=1 Tax=Gynuella sunshinyii TaxID=1445505 RepID=UPI001B80425A|nr:hypothetical protein [Gynuella sunshinyii]
MYKNFNRYYDPLTGRHISHDPLGLAAKSGECGDGDDDIKNATDYPVLTPSTSAWKDAFKLLNETRPELPYMPTYTDIPYKAGYEIHPNESHTKNAPQNNLPHIKWKDWSQGKKVAEPVISFLRSNSDERFCAVVEIYRPNIQ